MSLMTAWIRDKASGYLSLLVVTVVIARMLQYFWPNSAILEGQNPAVVFTLLSLVLILLLWSFYRAPRKASRNLAFFLALLAAAFAYEFLLGLSRDELWSYTAVVVPVALILLWLKPPSFPSVVTAMNTFCISLVGVAVIAQCAAGAGLVASRNYVEHRYFYFNQVDLLHWRWEGPFGNVNYSGPIGAYLLVYGLTRRGGLRVFLMSSGAIFMLASESRSAFFAAVVGVLVWLLCKPRIGRFALNPVAKSVAAVFVLALVALLIALLDPTINGRSEIWRDYLHVWIRTPLLGVGEGGIAEAMGSGQIIFSGETGHSLFIDTLSRSGILGFIFTVLVVGTVIALGWKAHRRGMSIGLILSMTFLAASLGELLTSWLYLSVLLLPLVLAGLMSGTWLAEHRQEQQLRT